MTRYVYDKDLQCMVELGEHSNRADPEKRLPPSGVISDIDPYRPVASDVAANGKRPVISGRRQHREFLQRNGYTEVGNSFVPNKREEMPRVGHDIKRALGE